MPAERRNLRSNKDTSSSSSTNGEKPRSNSQGSSSKDKPIPARAASKGKPQPAKKSSKDGSDEKQHPNGEPIENGVNGIGDVDMVDEAPAKMNGNKEGEDEMTVVVPPPKSSKLAGDGQDLQGDSAMEGVEKTDEQSLEKDQLDPKVKAVADIKGNFSLLERAVSQFDARFTLRVLRSMSSVRKHLSPDLLAQIITETYQPSSAAAKSFLAALGREDASFPSPEPRMEMDVDPPKEKAPGTTKTNASKDPLPEIDTYLSILVQIYLYDSRNIELGAKFSSNLVEGLKSLNRRTLDALAARVYFYYALFYEQLAPLPPSPQASVVSIRPHLLAALRTSVLRKDQDTHATVTTLLLRNYLSLSHITQADLLISHSKFPLAASNNQIARYLFYLGKIRAIQLAYTEAHEHLTSATRKSPATPSAGGFYQAASKLLVVVELLMGDIPDRAIFRQLGLEHAMAPYLSLVQAVRVGKIEGFLNVVQTHNALFRRDGTYTLILRLRQNVIKTGIRMMSLSYAKISLRDICLKLDLESEESAEYIVAKAIRDGVIEATLDHEHGYMKSKDSGDIYATREPGDAFHERIRACLGLHDESVKAMRFPMNQHRLELKNAQEARERERELAKEIVEGEMDDDDAGGDFEGMIDPSIRLRRAIHLNDLSLVRRIVKNNPRLCQNADFLDSGNTSLHLAAQLGLYQIAEFLIDFGHEDASSSISRNGNWDTPLHLAVQSKGKDGEATAELIARRFMWCIGWKNKQGADAVMLTSCRPSNTLLNTLLALTLFPPAPLTPIPPPSSSPANIGPTSSPSPAPPPPPPLPSLNPPYNPLTASDHVGNTALHYASSHGELKTIRTLIEHGADPNARNAWSWTPVAYSASVQAEVYFKGLIAAAGLVAESAGGVVGGTPEGRVRGGSGGKTAAGGGGGVRLVDAEGLPSSPPVGGPAGGTTTTAVVKTRSGELRGIRSRAGSGD